MHFLSVCQYVCKMSAEIMFYIVKQVHESFNYFFLFYHILIDFLGHIQGLQDKNHI